MFEHGWSPSDGLQAVRHPGEPTLFDLITGLCFLVDWDTREFAGLSQASASDLSQAPPVLDVTDTRRFAGEEQRRFWQYAFRTGAKEVERWALGGWNTKNGGFEIVFPLRTGQPIELIDAYDHTRSNMKQRLGGEEALFPPK